jgi:hypothetical protein
VPRLKIREETPRFEADATCRCRLYPGACTVLSPALHSARVPCVVGHSMEAVSTVTVRKTRELSRTAVHTAVSAARGGAAQAPAVLK